MKKFLLSTFVALALSLRLQAQTATVTSSAPTYGAAGGQITLTATINYPAGTNVVSVVAVTNGGTGKSAPVTTSWSSAL